ncbi:MAG: efflux RND transporter periplasmic adaptor subunit [Sphingopyxis sp.]
MNFESGTIAPAATAQDDWGFEAEQRRQSRRRWIVIGAVIAALLLAIFAWMSLSGGGSENAKTGAAPAENAKGGPAGGGGADSIPSVTVITPGRSQVERVITATGSLAARREMPVGVAGEGGQIVRVLVEPGQWVRAGQVLASVDRSVQVQQIAQLAAQIRVSEADARLAQAELDRATALSARGFISTSDLDRKTATRDAANARVRVARAQLNESRARTGRLDITAPAAGLVLTRGVEPGQVVSAGSGVLFRIARGGEMELLAQLSEGDLALLGAGARATVTPVGTAQAFAGQIWQVSPVIDPQSRQGTARIELSYSPALRPGGFAEARIIAGASLSPLLPESAVLTDEQGSYVYVIDRDNKAQRRAVTVGQVSDAGASILSGIDGSERIVLSAGAFLNPGDVVRPVRPVRPASAAPRPATPRPAATPSSAR